MKTKKLIIFIMPVFLFIILFLAMFPLTGAAAAAEPEYDSPGQEFMDDTESGANLYNQEKDLLPRMPGNIVPPKSKVISGTKLYINYKLWKDQGVLCYGYWYNVPDNHLANGFKHKRQIPGYPEEQNKGYYFHDGGRGEFRYHGYDVNGNKLTNLNFVPDSVVTKFDERAWINNPWYDLPDNDAHKPQQSNIYNQTATGGRPYNNPSIKPRVQNWINKSMQQYGGVPLLGTAVDPEAYRYLYVESAPTLLGLGQGRMWHKSVYNGSIWYQTISVPKLTELIDPDVTASIEEISGFDKNIDNVGNEMDDKEVTLKFRVTGVLRDEDIYNDPVKVTVYYTRYDIKNWIITFTGQEQSKKTVNDAINVVNEGSAEFEYKTTYGFIKSHKRET